MKTFQTTVTSPQLVIEHDDSPESPREWDNVGYFITAERNHGCPDNNQELEEIVRETQHSATNTESHMALVKSEVETELKEKVLYIAPVYRHEHGNVIYRRGTAEGFDVSNCGFYIVTKKSSHIDTFSKSIAEKIIDQELETYTNWCNGEVYRFTLFDEDGEYVDDCGGFYDIEDIREHLPEEWKEEPLEQYVVWLKN